MQTVKVESFYVIEYREKGSFVYETVQKPWGVEVQATVGNPFCAARYMNRDTVEKIVDRIQYQGLGNERVPARVIEVRLRMEMIESDR